MSCLDNIDIFLLVCNEIDTKNIIKTQLISNIHKDAIKKHEFINKQFYAKNYDIMDMIISKYNFKNLKLTHFKRYNDYIDYFVGCHTLDIRSENLTQENLKKLSGCYKISICGTDIYDDVIKYYRNCHTVSLLGSNMTNNGVKYLSKCQYLFSNSTWLTGDCAKYLSNVHTIHFPFVDFNNEIIHLKNCHTINTSGKYVTNDGFLELANCCNLHLYPSNIDRKLLEKMHCKKIKLDF